MSVKKEVLLDYTKEELQSMITPSFRTKQIWQWVYHKYVDDFKDMKNLPKEMQESLSGRYIINPLDEYETGKLIEFSKIVSIN